MFYKLVRVSSLTPYRFTNSITPYKNKGNLTIPSFSGSYQSSKSMLGYSNGDILSSLKEEKELTEKDRVFLASLDLDEEERTIFGEILKFENESARKNIQRYKSGNMRLDDVTRECARSKLKGLFSYFNSEKSLLKSEVQGIINILEQGSAESSNMEMLLDLVCDKKLPPSVLFGFHNGSKMNKNAEKDLDKLYLAYANNEDVKRTFVPLFNDEKEALDSLEKGDVCQIEGDKNISIKSKDGEIKRLHISPDTFLELFPPVERFAYNQSALGNCYMIAAIDAVFQNPESRERVLEIFKENEDGTIDACYGGFKQKNGVLVPKNDVGYVMKDVQKNLWEQTRRNFSNMSYSCEGLRAIEVLNQQTAEHKAEKKLKKQVKTYIKLYQNMKNKDFVCHDGFRYSKKEIELFLFQLYNEGIDGFISMGDRDDPPLFLHYEDIEEGLFELEKENSKDEMSTFQRLILERYKEHCERTGKFGISFREILPKELYFGILGQKPVSSANVYNAGGVSTSIFAKLGMNTMACKITSQDAFKILFDENCNSHYALTASGNRRVENKYGIIPNHGYSIEPFDIDGKRKFKIRNPQNSINEFVLDYDELKKYFVELGVGKI